MAHFAKVRKRKVVQVIVAEQDFIDNLVDTEPGRWVQTSYNTRGGVHLTGGTPLRKNYARIGDTYDIVRDAFISPKPFDSWTLNESTCLWEAPVAMPTDDAEFEDESFYSWNEDVLDWELAIVPLDSDTEN